MTEVLLKELNNSDIDWMLAMGTRAEVPAGTALINQGETVEALYILLDGELSVSVAQSNDNPLGRAFAALEGSAQAGREIATIGNGEMVGEIPFLSTYLSTTTVTAVQNSLVLFVPQHLLAAKLKKDISFAAHMYRASAIMLANRLERIVTNLSNSTLVLAQPQLREILFVFGELHDSDIDWMISAGKALRIPAGMNLVNCGRPVEALYILLDGKMALAACEDNGNLLAKAFSNLEENAIPTREFARLSRGDMVGETPFVEASQPAIAVRAVEDSLVLSIPRWRLAAKLLHDVSFAARFYRVLAILLADKQQGIISRIGYGRLTYSSGESLDDNCQYANELSSDFLAQVALAGSRFNWMLKKLGV